MALLASVNQALDTGDVLPLESQLDLSFGVRDVESRIAVSGPEEVLVIMRDITEQKAAEQAKSLLVSTVSHELRTPLTSIKGISELLLQEDDVGEDDRIRFLSIIDEESSRLTNLINDFLDISKIDSGVVVWDDQPTDIGELIKLSIESLRITAEQKDISLDVDLEDGLPMVDCDPHRLRQVIINLLSNAIKFTAFGHRRRVAP